MKSLLSMVRLMLKDAYRISSNERKGSRIAVASVILVLYLVFEYAVIVAAVQLSAYFAEQAMTSQFLAAVMVAGLTVIPVFGIMPMLNLMYFSTDAEFYLGLPVLPSKVYFAKLITVYISQLAVTAAILLPVLFAAGITIGLNWVFYVVTIFAVFLLPAASLMILSVVCIPLMYLVRFFRSRGAASSLMTLVLFVAIFFAYMALMRSPTFSDEAQLGDMLRGPVQKIADIFIPIHAIARFSTFTRIEPYGEALSMLFNFFIFAVPMFLLFAATMLISRKVYSAAVAAQLEGRRTTAAGSAYRGASGRTKALVVKEWKNIVRTPIFTVQCFFGLIIAPVALALIGLGGEKFNFGFDPSVETAVVWLAIGTFLQMLVVSVNIGASTTFSRDGKALYLIKLMPVPYGTVVRSKLVFYNLLYDADLSLCVLIWLAVTRFSCWWMGMIVWVYLLVVNYGFTSLCLLLDLSCPKSEWKSYREVVKNSRNAQLPTLVGIASSIAIGAASIAGFMALSGASSISLATGIVAVALLGGAFAFAFVARTVLNSGLRKYFDRIEV